MRVSNVQWIREFDSADLAESGNSRITLISESGLYRILAKCNLPKCEPWFVAKDVCECLDLGNPSQACQNLDDDDDDEKQVVTREFDSLLFRESKAQDMMLISESGLYTLIMRSNKLEAKAFKRWVNHEVLPPICETDRKLVWDEHKDIVEMARKTRKS